MALTVEMEKPAALKLINKAIPFIFGQPSSVFLTAPVRKILFEGVPLYCNVTDFSAKAICGEIRKKDKDFHNLGNDVFGFSFFGMVSSITRSFRQEITCGGRQRSEIFVHVISVVLK